MHFRRRRRFAYIVWYNEAYFTKSRQLDSLSAKGLLKTCPTGAGVRVRMLHFVNVIRIGFLHLVPFCSHFKLMCLPRFSSGVYLTMSNKSANLPYAQLPSISHRYAGHGGRLCSATPHYGPLSELCTKVAVSEMKCTTQSHCSGGSYARVPHL